MTKVFIRPRPLATAEAGDAIVRFDWEHETSSLGVSHLSPQRFLSFAGVLSPANDAAYAEAVRPLLSTVLAGRTACCFAYGHTNSGKTHTIFGYGREIGMYERAIRELFDQRDGADWMLQTRFFELYNGKVFDLLDNRRPGFVREDADGGINVRSETTIGPQGAVRTQGLKTLYETSADAVVKIVRNAMCHRAEGTSELHHQSSRSHAVLELEIVTREIADARTELEVAKSLVVPIGKARDDLYIAIQTKLYVRGDDGKYKPSGASIPRDDEEKLKGLEDQLRAAEEVVETAARRVAEAEADFRGGCLVLIDLAGAEYTGQGLSRNPKEMKEAREINLSLLALKECVRAQALKDRIPYRNSKLTMLLKRHLEVSTADSTVMIATVSTSQKNLKKAHDTLKYAALVAEARSC
ncbi:hypothetical protein PINS_up003338 [Pythium insidiosum]|nr:hypothetical protein PINS_up003338 [Pythium insidiosum]